MTAEQINRTIYEAMGNHPNAWVMDRGKYLNPSYTSSWADYGPMLEWAMRQEWWGDFHEKVTFGEFRSRDIIDELLNPLCGSTTLAEFIVANPQYFGRP